VNFPHEIEEIVSGADKLQKAIEKQDPSEKIDCCATKPRDISSRSTSVNANRDRFLGTGRIPPVGLKWL
jgi:hypothetical protein